MCVCGKHAIYAISYQTNGGEIVTGKSDSYTHGTETSLPTEVSKTGCKFKGWYLSGDTGETIVSAIGSEETGDKIFVAKWEEKKTVYIDRTAQTYTFCTAAEHNFIVNPASGAPTSGYTVEYYVNGAWVKKAPENAAVYDVKITRSEDEDYKAFSAEIADGFVIAKAASEIDVSGVVVSYTYTGKLQTVIGGATLNHNEKPLVYSNNTFTTVAEGNGKTVTISVEESANYTAASKTVKIGVSKATYEMTDVSFEDGETIYDGNTHGLEIIGELPLGVSVAYVNNGQTESGIYIVTAKFIGDGENYDTIADMSATLTIKQASIENIPQGGDEGKPDVIVKEEGGTSPDVQLVVVKQEEIPEKVQNDAKRDEIVAAVYDITLKSNGVTVQPSGKLMIRLLIPEEARGKVFRILHLHEDEVTEVEYTTDGDYAVFTVDKLSEFSFVVENGGSALWLIIVLAIIVATEIALIVLKKRKNGKNKKKSTRLAAVIFGGIIPVYEIVLLAALGIAAVVLGAYVIRLYLSGKNTDKTASDKKPSENDLIDG